MVSHVVVRVAGMRTTKDTGQAKAMRAANERLKRFADAAEDVVSIPAKPTAAQRTITLLDALRARGFARAFQRRHSLATLLTGGLASRQDGGRRGNNYVPRSRKRKHGRVPLRFLHQCGAS